MSEDTWKAQGITTEEPFRLEGDEVIFREYEYPPKEPLSESVDVNQQIVDALNKAYQQGWAEAAHYYKERK